MNVKASPALLALALGLCAGHALAMSPGQALQMAAERDPALASSRAAFAAETEAGEQERSALRPTFGLVSDGYFNHSDSTFAFGSEKDNYPSWSAYLQARQPLFRMDWSARGDRADLREALARENLEDRLRSFVARVSQRYLDTLLAEDEVDQAEGEARAVRESLNDTRKRYEVELVPGTDLKEAQARDDLSQAELVSARAGAEQARDALQEVTGYDRARLPRLREDMVFPALDPVEVEGWLKIAADNSTATTAGKLRLQLATADLKSRRAEAWPTVDLVAQAGRTDSLDYALGARQDDAKVGVELNLPIYAGGYNTSRVREAEARVQEATSELQRASLETDRSIRSLFRAVETARLRSSAYSRALDSAVLAEAASRNGYDAGTRTINDVLDAKSRVTQARRNRNAARYDLLTQSLLLYAAAGILDTAAVARADALFESR